jgi:hypothetical protein
MLKHLKTKSFVAAAAAVLLVSGCSSNSKPDYQDPPPNPDAVRTERLENTQMNSGARYESTLYIDHFDGPGLSSLGTERLDMLLADSHSCNPLVIYLDIPDDDSAQPRRDAVGRYLQDKGGLKPEQIVFRSGANPAIDHPAAPDITNYSKTDTGTDSGGTTSGH